MRNLSAQKTVFRREGRQRSNRDQADPEQNIQLDMKTRDTVQGHHGDNQLMQINVCLFFKDSDLIKRFYKQGGGGAHI